MFEISFVCFEYDFGNAKLHKKQNINYLYPPILTELVSLLMLTSTVSEDSDITEDSDLNLAHGFFKVKVNPFLGLFCT